MPLRIAITGSMAGPDIASQLHVLALADGATEAPYVPVPTRIADLEAALVSLPVPETAAA